MGSRCRPHILSRVAACDRGHLVSDLSIIIALVFLAATLAVYGFYWVFIFNRREQRVINRRLELGRQLRNPTAVLATLRVPESNWLVACIFPVFIACILGFMMSIYAWSEYGTPLGAGSLIVPLAAVVFIRKPLSTRTLFIVICGATVVGLICARFAFLAADLG